MDADAQADREPGLPETPHGQQSAACQVETIFVAGRCFPDIKGAPDFKALVPRVSGVYDLFGDGRTALKFSASRYDQPITLQNVLRLNPLGATNDTRVWTACALPGAPNKTSACDLTATWCLS